MILEGTALEIEYARDTMPRGRAGYECSHDGRVPPFYCQPTAHPAGLSRAVPWRAKPIPLDVGNHGSPKREKFL